MKPSVTSSVEGPAGYDAQVRITGDGPPLIYVPGMDGTGQLFYRQVPLLSSHYRVVTYRLRDAARTMDVLVADLHAILEQVCAPGERAILVGESFGGALSLTYARDHEPDLSAMVILNSFALFGPKPLLWLAIWGIRMIPWFAMRLVRRLTAWRLHSPFTHRDDKRQFYRLTANTTKKGYLNRLGILRSYDATPTLSHLHVPTLFLAADNDRLIPSVREARKMVACMPQASMQVLAGFGHSCFLSSGLDMSRVLRDWLGSSGA